MRVLAILKEVVLVLQVTQLPTPAVKDIAWWEHQLECVNRMTTYGQVKNQHA